MIIPPLRPLFVPIALLLPMMLAACGGGGGSSSGLSPNQPTYNRILFGSETPIDGTLHQYSLNGAKITLASGTNEISGTVNGNNGNLTSIDITVTFQGSILFTEKFDNFTETTATASEFGVGYKFQSIDNGTQGVQKMTFFDPKALGFEYSALGIWECEACPGSGIAPSVGGYFSMGAITFITDIPTTSTANYSGKLVGTYADNTNVYSVGASALANANFGTQTVTFWTENTQKVIKNSGGTPTLDTNLDIKPSVLTTTLTSTTPGYQLKGTLETKGGMRGPADALYYGPQAAELGGTFFVSDNPVNPGASTKQMVGGFALKKQ